MSAKIIWRGLLVLALDAVALILLAAVLPGFRLDDGWAALAAAAVIGILNALVWPVLARIALPLTVLTLGARRTAAQRAPGHLRDQPHPRRPHRRRLRGDRGHDRHQRRDLDLLRAAGDRRGRHLVPQRRLPPGRGRRATIDTEVPGIVFLEIDGLAHEVLRRAVIDGNAPHIGALAARAARTDSSAGRPTGPRRPAPARPGSCTATTTTCPPSAGGRRTATRRSSPTTPATPKSSSGAIPTGAACCTRTAPAAPTSSPATRRTRC